MNTRAPHPSLSTGFLRLALGSLAWRLGVTIGLATGLILIGMAWLHYQASRKQLIEQAHSEALKHVRLAAGYVDETVGHVSSVARALAAYVESNGEQPTPQLDAFMVNLLAKAPAEEVYSCYVAFDARDWHDPSSLRSVERKKWPEVSPATADFHGVENEWYNGTKQSRALHVSEPYFEKSGSRLTMISVGFPIIGRSGEFVGATGANVALSQIQDIVQRVRFRSADQPGEVDQDYAFLVSRSGQLISHPNAALLTHEGVQGADAAIFREGQAVLTSPTGAEIIGQGSAQRMVFWTLAPVTGWRIALSVPTRMILEPVRKLALQSAAIGGAGLLIMLGVVTITARGFTRPLHRLRMASESVEAGNYDLSTLETVAQGHDELAQLARSFQRMLREIQNRESRLGELNMSLEKTVAARTSALTAAETEARQLALVASRTHNGVLISGPSGKIEWVNEGFCRLTGYTPQESIGQSDDKFLIGDETPASVLAEKKHAWENRQPYQLEALFHDHNAQNVWLYIDAQPVFDEPGKLARYIIVLVDITKRKKAEEDARAAREAAEAANRTKSAFLANMSHELRTPMNAIIGYSEMLMEEANDLGNDSMVPDLEKIHSAGKHLLVLINDVLDLSKIEAGKMTLFLEEFSVSQVVKDVVSTIQPLVQKNENKIVTHLPDEPNVMTADATKVRQTLFNLLSNAVKFTAKGVITLSLERMLRDDREFYAFKVTDTGIGMTAEQINKLFQAFTQADASTTRKYGGTGLGLTISRNFCRLMGGDIAVESELGAGTVFTAFLPVRVSEPQNTRSPFATRSGAPFPSNQPPGPIVLAVDDDPGMLELLSRNLIREGYSVRTALTGDEALVLAEELQPRLITLDVMMPGRDGWSVLTALKQNVKTRDIPIVVISMIDDKNVGLELGAVDYLTKPIERGQLAVLLQKHAPLTQRPLALVVDDLAENRALLSRVLDLEGWKVIEADSGRAGLRMVSENTPHMILLDLTMPEMNGFEFLRELRERQSGRDVPVTVITAKDLTEAERAELTLHVQSIVENGSQSTRESFLAEVRRAILEVRRTTSSTPRV